MSNLPYLLEHCKKCIETQQRFFTDDFEIIDYAVLEDENKIIYKDKKKDNVYSCTVDVFIKELEKSFITA